MQSNDFTSSNPKLPQARFFPCNYDNIPACSYIIVAEFRGPEIRSSTLFYVAKFGLQHTKPSTFYMASCLNGLLNTEVGLVGV